MNRFLIIVTVTIVVIAVVAGFIYLSRSATPAAPVGQWSTTPVDNSYTTAPQAQSIEAVKAVYQKALSAAGYPDNIKPGTTVVAGMYALQMWTGDHTGGEALLKFDSTRNEWIIVDPGGGAWSIEGLVEFGVPTSTAQALVGQLAH